MAVHQYKLRGAKSPTFSVEVTADMIADAIRRDSAHCMVADALRVAADPERYFNIEVDLYVASVTDRIRNLRFHYHLPRNVQLALIDFDRGIVPEPFRVVLRGANRITRSKVAAKPGETPEQRKARVASNLMTGAVVERRRVATAHRLAQSDPDDRVAKRRSKLDLLRLMDDPSEPLGPPKMVEERSAALGIVSVGGRPHPRPSGAAANFAKKRWFGIRSFIA